MKALFFSVSVLFITSCGVQRENRKYGSDTKVAIITDSSYIRWLTGKNYKIWVPTQEEHTKVDEILSKGIVGGEFYFLKDQSLSELKSYYRQYLCYVNDSGEKIVYINSMCKLPTKVDDKNRIVEIDWKNDMVDIADGGSCYWNVKVNIEKSKYYDLTVNGES